LNTFILNTFIFESLTLLMLHVDVWLGWPGIFDCIFYWIHWIHLFIDACMCMFEPGGPAFEYIHFE